MPTATPQSTTKQYFVLASSKYEGFGKWKEGEIIRLSAVDAIPFVAQNAIVPLSVAIKEKIYPPKEKDTVVEKLREAILGNASQPVVDKLKEEDEKTKSTKKSFLSNELRESVQKKRADIEAEEEKSAPKSSSISADKLAKIKAGGN